MRIAVIGIGHSGIITALCLCEFGHCISCYDINQEVIFKLKIGQSKISEIEPCVNELIKKYINLHSLMCYTNLFNALQDVDAVFITVSQDSDIKSILVSISSYLSHSKYTPIFIKTHLPLGSMVVLEKNLTSVRPDLQNLDLIYHPNFFRTGSGIHDFVHSNILVFGLNNNSQKAIDISKKIYERLLPSKDRFIFTDYYTAELIKICIAGSITINNSFYTELSELCINTNANFLTLIKCISANSNVSNKLVSNLYSYHKVLKNLVTSAQQYGVNLSVLSSAISKSESNLNKIIDLILNEQCEKIAIFGIVPNHLDICESKIMPIVQALIKNKKCISIYSTYKWIKEYFPNEITICESAYDTVNQADLLVITNDFPELSTLNMQKIYDIMRTPKLIDCANIVNYKFTKIAVNQ